MSETLRKYGAKYNTTFCSLCGLSTDTKPTGDFDGVGIANGSEFIEMDTGKKFKYDAESSVWNEVSSGGGGSTTLIEKSITANGEYNASADNADGYSKVTVDVAGGGGETFDVEITMGRSDFTANKTYSETIEALNSGKMLNANLIIPNIPFAVPLNGYCIVDGTILMSFDVTIIEYPPNLILLIIWNNPQIYSMEFQDVPVERE